MTQTLVRGNVAYFCDGCGRRITTYDQLSSWRIGERRVHTHGTAACRDLALQTQPDQMSLEFA